MEGSENDRRGFSLAEFLVWIVAGLLALLASLKLLYSDNIFTCFLGVAALCLLAYIFATRFKN